MKTLGENFNLTEYSDNFINNIVNYRFEKGPVLNRFLSYEEIAQCEGCGADEVERILCRTAIIWEH